MRAIIDKQVIIDRYEHLKEIAEDSTRYIISYKKAIDVAPPDTRTVFVDSLPYMVEQDQIKQKEFVDYEMSHAEYFI